MRLLGLLVAGLPLAIGSHGRWLEPMIDPKRLAGAIGVAVVLAVIARERIKTPPPQDGAIRRWWREPLYAGAALVCGGLALSALASPVVGLGLWTAVHEASYVALAIAVASHRPRPLEMRWLAACLLAMTAVESLLALGQHFAPGLVSLFFYPGYRWPGGRAGVIGTFGNTEYLASWLAMGLAVATVAAVGVKDQAKTKKWMPLVLAAVAALAFATIFLSGGRGAFLAAAGGLTSCAAMAYLHLRGRMHAESPHEAGRAKAIHLRMAVGLAIGMVLLGLLAVDVARREPVDRRSALPARLAELFDPHSASIRQRMGMAAITSRMIGRDPLLGAGPGRYGAAFGEMHARLASSERGIGFWALAELFSGNYVGEAHCDPLQWWAEYGLLPLLGLFLMLARALETGQRAWRAGQAESWWVAGLWAALATLGINMWVSFPLHLPTRALAFWALLGAVAGRGIEAGSQSEFRNSKSETNSK